MEPRGPMAYSQGLSNNLYTELNQFNSSNWYLFFKIYYNIVLPSVPNNRIKIDINLKQSVQFENNIPHFNYVQIYVSIRTNKQFIC